MNSEYLCPQRSPPPHYVKFSSFVVSVPLTMLRSFCLINVAMHFIEGDWIEPITPHVLGNPLVLRTFERNFKKWQGIPQTS